MSTKLVCSTSLFTYALSGIHTHSSNVQKSQEFLWASRAISQINKTTLEIRRQGHYVKRTVLLEQACQEEEGVHAPDAMASVSKAVLTESLL